MVHPLPFPPMHSPDNLTESNHTEATTGIGRDSHTRHLPTSTRAEVPPEIEPDRLERYRARRITVRSSATESGRARRINSRRMPNERPCDAQKTQVASGLLSTLSATDRKHKTWK
jgi:hypothetical protein